MGRDEKYEAKLYGGEKGNAEIEIYTKKKTICYKERDEEARAEWKEEMKEIKLENVFFMDECSVQEDIQEEYAYARKGKRANGSFSQNKRNRFNIISLMGWEGIKSPIYLEGNVDNTIMKAYAETELSKSLRREDIIVMDNASFHKGSEFADLVKKAGARIIFLPTYSPDLNPIEELWSQLKALKRKEKIC
jgi:transposase